MTFEVSLIETGGWKTALRALRRPMNKEPGASSETGIPTEEDLRLFSILVKRGDDHAKAVRMIRAGLTIRAPRYWWQEMDTYHIGVDKVSESTMHRKMSEPFTNEDFEDGCCPAELNVFRASVLGEALPLWQLKSAIPEGFLQTRDLSISYQTLRRIYFARRSHRLPHWQAFCAFIETLPYAKELILVEEKQ